MIEENVVIFIVLCVCLLFAGIRCFDGDDVFDMLCRDVGQHWLHSIQTQKRQ